MPRMGNPSISKFMFAHSALLGFQRAGGLFRRFFVTTLTLHRFPAFASRERRFFQKGQRREPPARPAAFIMNSFCFPCGKTSLNSSEMPPLADGCPSLEW